MQDQSPALLQKNPTQKMGQSRVAVRSRQTSDQTKLDRVFSDTRRYLQRDRAPRGEDGHPRSSVSDTYRSERGRLSKHL
jgi:hypothetical protein